MVNCASPFLLPFVLPFPWITLPWPLTHPPCPHHCRTARNLLELKTTPLYFPLPVPSPPRNFSQNSNISLSPLAVPLQKHYFSVRFFSFWRGNVAKCPLPPYVFPPPLLPPTWVVSCSGLNTPHKVAVVGLAFVFDPTSIHSGPSHFHTMTYPPSFPPCALFLLTLAIQVFGNHTTGLCVVPLYILKFFQAHLKAQTFAEQTPSRRTPLRVLFLIFIFFHHPSFLFFFSPDFFPTAPL